METDKGRGERRSERKLYKSKKHLFASGHFYKIRVPSDKRSEGHATYKSFNLQVVENKGRGECLFLAILHHLQHEKYGSINPGGPRTAMDVRLDIVEFLIENWMDYVELFVNYDPVFQNRFERYGCLEWDNIEKCQKMYRKYMSKLTTYGTCVELQAATKLYDFKCILMRVLSDDTLSVSIINDEKKEKRDPKRTCFILFDGDPDSGHFRFLKPVGNVLPLTAAIYQLNTIENISTATFVEGKPHTTTYARYSFEGDENFEDNEE